MAGVAFRPGKWVGGAVAIGLVVSGCGWFDAPASMLDPAGPVAASELTLINSSLVVMVCIFLVVAGALVVALIRFRQRAGSDRRLPPPIEGDTRLELLWTVVPAVLIALLAVGTVRSTFVLGAYLPARQALHVDVTGHQFWWDFNYRELGLDTANQLHIPVGQRVELVLRSADVMHAFWVPRLGGKTTLVPGRTNYLWIEASQPGTYVGQCAEFCGRGHADMRLVVVAEAAAKFQQWINRQRAPQSPPTSALARQGMQLFQARGCSSCHTIAGTGFAGPVGPNLTHLMQRTAIAGNLLPNTPANLAAWLKDPPAVKPGALMPNLHLSGGDIRALVAYLRSLR